MMSNHVFQHRLYGLSIDSVFALPGAPVARRAAGDADLTISWSSHAAEKAEPVEITIPAGHNGAPAFGVGKDGAHALIWDGEITFLISPDARSLHVVCRPEKLEFVPTVIVGMALGLVLHLRNVLCLHATVLERAGRTIAVMGNSGSGKSSLAAAMVRDGARFYSDDLAALTRTDSGGYQVLPGCMGLRIHADSAAELLGDAPTLGHVPYLDKSLWDLTGQALPASPPRLDALYWLRPSADGERPEVSAPLPPRDALTCVIRAWYPPQCRRLLSRARLDQMRDLAGAVPVHVVHYQQRWESLPSLLELLP